MSNLPKKLMQLFNTTPVYDIDNLSSVYSESAVFEDPVIRIKGLGNISKYLKRIYSGVIDCRFNYDEPIVGKQQAAISWLMTLRHNTLGKGKPINVRGCSIISYDEKIYYHRDYYDVGEMLYEHLPVLGRSLKFVKKRIH